jgi:Raf kinase inhibitor-like YbhB/YbcL family protein
MLEKMPAVVGRALRDARPSLTKLTFHSADMAHVPELIRVSSEFFADGGMLPPRCTEDGGGISPPLQWWGVPQGAQSVVLLIEDADSPTPQPLVHALVWGMAGGDGELEQGALNEQLPDERMQLGRNSLLRSAYLPPDPPPGHGRHRYLFQVYAINQPLGLSQHPGRGELLDAMRGHVMAKGCITGLYKRD